MIKEDWLKKGFVDEPVPADLDLKQEIRKMCQEKNAVIMSHYYTSPAIQEAADFVGDSLALAQKAAQTQADIIVMCGVHFMGETGKMLCPQKKVLVPDLNASCSLAQSCPQEEFARFIERHPGHTVVSYVNTTAQIKALTDVVVTSGNARQIVQSLPPQVPIVFGPDRNLGQYISRVTGRDMVLWDGACHVHERFRLKDLNLLRGKHPEAHVLVHPECRRELADAAHCVGSTAALLAYARNTDAREFIVVTESGILHEMRRGCLGKTFIPLCPDGAEGTCNECEFMRMISLQKLYNTLKHEWPEILIDPELAEKARRPIDRMLEISARLGL